MIDLIAAFSEVKIKVFEWPTMTKEEVVFGDIPTTLNPAERIKSDRSPRPHQARVNFWPKPTLLTTSQLFSTKIVNAMSNVVSNACHDHHLFSMRHKFAALCTDRESPE